VVAAAVFAFVLVAISSVGASAAAAPGESSTIWIVGNDDLLYQKALYSWPGTGSSSDPIIIDGLTINAASMSENNCIIVSGTDLYVVISNCHLSGSGAYFSNAAIYLELADHIQVIGNEFSSIPFASIYIFQCSDISVTDNQFAGGSYGLYAEGCDGLTLHGNEFTSIGSEAIHVDGSDFFSEGAVVEDNIIGAYSGVILTDCGHSVIKNNTLTATGTGWGILATSSDNCIIDNNTASGFGDGIVIWSSGYSTISNNTISACVQYGIRVDLSIVLTWYNRIENNSVAGGNYAIWAKSSEYLFIYNNTCPGSTYADVYVVRSNHTTIAHNYLRGSQTGITLGDFSYYALIIDNDCQQNQKGIAAMLVSHGEITNNNCSRCTSYGIWLTASPYMTIQRNNCTLDRVGMFLTENSGSGSIVHNNITRNTDNGIQIQDTAVLDIAFNNISGNAVNGLNLNGCTQVTVRGNLFLSNTYHGVEVYTASDSFVSYVYWNTFKYNYWTTDDHQSWLSQVYDQRGNTRWNRSDAPLEGNYWADWQYADDNHDGVVDFPYPIVSSSNFDHYPLNFIWAPSTPDMPLNLEVVTGNQYATLTWEEPYNGGEPIEGYVIYVNGELNDFTGSLTCTVMGLTNFQTYTLGVAAYNALGIGPIAEIEATPTVSVPTAPVNLVADFGDASVSLTWEAPVNDGGLPLTTYLISLNDGVVVYDTTDTHLTIIGLSNGFEYWFTVRAVNSLGMGPDSNKVFVTPFKVHDVIRINSDAELRAMAISEGWWGEGTDSSPYLIEGYGIDADGEKAAFYIGNTTLCVFIRDSYFTNSGIYNEVSYGGLVLYNAQHVFAYNVNCSGNPMNGISIYKSDGANIRYCLLYDNWIGVRIYQSSSVFLDSNHICGNSYMGIMAEEYSADCTVIDNVISYNPLGISMISCDYWSISLNVITYATNDAGAGIYILGCNGDYISRNTLSYNGYGINVGPSMNLVIDNNTIVGNRHYGIRLGDYTDSSNNIGNRVENNTCSENDLGIYLAKAYGGMVVDNTVEDNTYHGILATTESTGVGILRNHVHGNYDGIQVDDALGPIVSGNNCTGNFRHGIILIRSGFSTIDDNDVSDCGGDGILLTNAGGAVVTNNIAEHNQVGIMLNENSGNCYLRYNYFRYASQHGVYIGDLGECVIAFNNISHNGQDGIYITGSFNVRVYGNMICQNSLYGVAIFSPTESYVNDIFWNNFIGNHGATAEYDALKVQALDMQTSNWCRQDLSQGNYWNDWTMYPGPDGISTEPYFIPGYGGYDYYPLTDAWYPSVPDAPTNLEAVAGAGYVALTWTMPYHGGEAIDYYAIYQDGVDVYHADDIACVIYGLTNFVTYEFTVAAHNRLGLSDLSDPASATPFVSVPTAPRNLQWTPQDGYVTISWEAPENDGGLEISGYHAYVDGLDMGATTNRFADLYLNPLGTEHRITVTAENELGEGPAGDAIFATAFKLHGPLIIPSEATLLELKASEGWSGSGETTDDPIIIEGYAIDAEGGQAAIYIGAVFWNVLIRNCYLTNSGTSNEIYNGGIVLVNSGGIRIQNTNCSGNGMNGISLQGVINVEIQDCDIFDCRIGLRIVGAGNINVNETRIAGCTMMGVSSINAGISFRDCEISYCQQGVTIQGSSGVVFSGVHITNCTNSGSAAIYMIDSDSVRVHDSDLSDNAYGIDMHSVHDILIDNNTILRSGHMGIRLGEDTDDLVNLDAVIENTTCSGGEYGIVLEKAAYCLLKDNTCEDNTYSGIQVNSGCEIVVLKRNHAHGNYDAFVADWSDAILQANDLSSNDRFGIRLTNCAEMLIEGNTISENGEYGISMSISPRNTIRSNFISYCRDGMLVDASGSNEITNNTIFNVINNGIFVQNSGGGLIGFNMISGSGWIGVGITNSFGLVVRNNSIAYSGYYGVYADSVDSFVSTFYWNVFNGNHGASGAYSASCVQAYDAGTDVWYNTSTSLGNYWLDWTVPNPDRDTTVDLPYAIDGGDNEDLYPQVSPNWPSQPLNLKVEGSAYFAGGDAYAGRMILTWDAPEFSRGEVQGYDIYRGTASGETSFLTRVTGRYYEDSGLPLLTWYYYNVTAYNQFDIGPTSAEVLNRTGKVADAPTMIMCHAIDYGDPDVQNKLMWNVGVTYGLEVLSFNIYRGTESGDLLLLANVPEGVYHEYVDESGLVIGETYYYQISTITLAGEGQRTPEASCMAAKAPTEVRNLAGLGGNDIVHLTWEVPESTWGLSTNYSIYRGPSSGMMQLLDTTDGLEYTDNDVENGEVWLYRITPFNDALNGPSSYTDYIEVNPVPPSEPTNLILTPGDENITVEWAAPENPGGSNVIGYKIYLDESGTPVATAASSPYVITGLVNGVSYMVTVTAYSDDGEGPGASEWATPYGAPDAPEGLYYTVETGMVFLHWNEPFDGGFPIIGYYVYRWTTDPYDQIQRSVDWAWYEDVDVIEGVTYHYQVTALNAGGESPRSEIVTATPGAPGAPDPVYLHSSDGMIDLSWAEPSGGGYSIIGYNIYRWHDGSAVENISLEGASTTYTDIDLTNGVEYHYLVRALNEVRYGPNSTEIWVEAGLPVTPVLSGIAGDSSARLIWTAEDYPGYEITGFVLNRYYDGDVTYIPLGKVYSYDDTGLTNGNIYQYRVLAINPSGEGSLSNEVSLTVGNPSAPTNLGYILGSDQVELSWSPPESDGGSDILRYWVYGEDDGGWGEFFEVEGLSHLVTELELGRTYSFYVAAENEFGTGQWAEFDPFTLTTVPGKPGLELHPADGIALNFGMSTGGKPLLYAVVYRWTEGTDPISFNIDLVEDDVNPEAYVYVDTDVTFGIEYYYQISGVNDNGEGPRSDAARLIAGLPSAPLSINAQAEGVVINITWDEPFFGSPIVEYIVYLFTTDGGYVWNVWNPIATVPGTQCWHEDTGRTPGVVYQYTVAARNANGVGPLGSGSAAVLQPMPSAPLNLQGEVVGGTIVLTWEVPSDNGGADILGYIIRRNGDERDRVPGLTWTDDSVYGGMTYTYEVAAYNEFTDGVNWAEVSVEMPATAPGVPHMYEAEAGVARAMLSWSAPWWDGGDPITTYILVRYDTNDATTTELDLGLVYHYNDTTVSVGTDYVYWIRAVNSVGSTESNHIVFVGGAPSAPLGLRVWYYGGQAWISWSPPAYCPFRIYSYTVYMELDGEWWVYGVYGNGILSMWLNSPDYRFAVQANGDYPGGAWNISEYTPLETSRPNDVIGYYSGDRMSLYWQPPYDGGLSPIIEYQVTARTLDPMTEEYIYTPIGTTTGLNIDLPMDNPEAVYFVQARNSQGLGSMSYMAYMEQSTVPSVPQGLDIIAGDLWTSLNWTVPEYLGCGPVTYSVYRDSVLIASGVTALEYLDETVEKGVTYSYQVSATNHAGESLLSEPVEFYVRHFEAPTAVIDAPTTTNSLTVDFDASGASSLDDPTSLLEVAWDWTNDGILDTEWMTTKTASHTFPDYASYVVALHVRDSIGLIGTTTATVEILEKKLTILAYVGDASAQYSDVATWIALLTDGDGSGVPGKVVQFTYSSITVSATTNGEGYASVAIVMTIPAQTGNIQLQFAGDDDYFASNGLSSFEVRAEDATLTYTGDTVISTLGSIYLRANAVAANDGTPGDITLMQVSFKIYAGLALPENLIRTLGPFGMIEISPGSGYFYCTSGPLPVGSYTIVVENYPAGYYQASPAVGTVSSSITGTKSVSGAGAVLDGSRLGEFSFSLMYRNGVASGFFKYVYYEGAYKYVITATSFRGLEIAGDHAYFDGTCTMQKYSTATGKLLETKSGNFRVDIWDSPMLNKDKFQLQVWNANGTMNHQVYADGAQRQLFGKIQIIRRR
jgi:titin